MRNKYDYNRKDFYNLLKNGCIHKKNNLLKKIFFNITSQTHFKFIQCYLLK